MANQFTATFEEMETPNKLHNKIDSIEMEMEDNIHDLVWQFGKMVNDGDYEFSMYNKSTKSYCIINDTDGKSRRIKKCRILCPDKCQVRGHLMMDTTDGEVLSFCNLVHQQFNVYSHIYRMVEGRM